MTSPIFRDCVKEASFEPGVGPWICAGADFPKVNGMVMKGDDLERKEDKQIDVLVVQGLKRRFGVSDEVL